MDNSLIPSLNDATVFALNFAAYKTEDRISFVRRYDPKTTAIEGMRHAVLRYRVTEKMKAGATAPIEKPSQMVTIPQIEIPADWVLSEKASKVLLGILEDGQDNLIKGLIEDKKASVIGWDLLSVDCVLDALTAVRVSDRLTKADIEAWASVAIKDACYTRAKQIAEEKQDMANIAKYQTGTHQAYTDLFAKLAAPVPNVGHNDAISGKNLILIAKLDDDMAKALLRKLEVIINPPVLKGNTYL